MKHRKWLLSWLGLAGGCVVVVPPPSHLTGVPATVARDGVSGDAAAAVGLEPAGSLAVSYGATRFVALDLLGQASNSHASLTPGVWCRLPLDREQRHRLGLRAGVVGGSGALAEAFAFENPYLGPSLHFQYGWRFGENPRNPGILAATIGAEYTVPADGAWSSFTTATGTGSTTGTTTESTTSSGSTTADPEAEADPYLLFPGAWVSMDLRLEVPVGPQLGVTFGLGADSGPGALRRSRARQPEALAVPHVSAGLRLTP